MIKDAPVILLEFNELTPAIPHMASADGISRASDPTGRAARDALGTRP